MNLALMDFLCMHLKHSVRNTHLMIFNRIIFHTKFSFQIS